MKINLQKLDPKWKAVAGKEPELFLRLELELVDDDGLPWVQLRGCMLFPPKHRTPTQAPRPANLVAPRVPFHCVKIPPERGLMLGALLMEHPQVQEAFGGEG